MPAVRTRKISPPYIQAEVLKTVHWRLRRRDADGTTVSTFNHVIGFTSVAMSVCRRQAGLFFAIVFDLIVCVAHFEIIIAR